MLGYSERIIPIANARKSSDPVALFKKIRQLACSVHHALEKHWRCPSRKYWSHQPLVSPRAESKVVILNVLFVLEDEQKSRSELIKEEVEIQLVEDDVAEVLQTAISIGHVQPAMRLTKMQEVFEDVEIKRQRPRLSSSILKATKGTLPTSSNGRMDLRFPTKGGK